MDNCYVVLNHSRVDSVWFDINDAIERARTLFNPSIWEVETEEPGDTRPPKQVEWR